MEASGRRLLVLRGAAVVAAVAISGVLWFGFGAAPQTAPVAATPQAVTTTQAAAGAVGPPSVNAAPGGEHLMTVHVSGEVAAPGVVRLGPGSRVADAVAAAGGASSSADLSLLNLAALLSDGEQVIVPKPGATKPLVNGPRIGDSAGPVHLNSAELVDLVGLPGVGPVLAQRILAYRDSNGPFESAEDLLDIAGIGEGKLAGLRDAVIVP